MAKVIWKYDACGEYFDYKGYVVLRQTHPKLAPYLICKVVGKEEQLIDQDIAYTIPNAKDTIDKLISGEIQPRFLQPAA